MRRSICLLALAAACLFADLALAQIDREQFRRDLATLTSSPSRVIGSKGYDDAGRYLEREIRKLPSVELRTHEFTVMMPVTQSATLELGDGHVESVYPFWPAHIRVNATPFDGITGKLVYVAQCRYEQLRPASLKGQIAVIEANAGERWVDAFYCGAKAMIVLGAADTTWCDLNSHDLRVPANLPRFYVPAGKLADDLRAGRIGDATLKASVTWQPRTARNFYALVRPAKTAPAGWNNSLPPAAITFSVPYESSSLVPDLSPGASQATQAACGLALLRDVAARAWDRPVFLYFSGGDSVQNLATRNMFMALAKPPIGWREEIDELEAKIKAVDRDLVRAKSLADTPQALSVRDDRALIERITKILDTDLALEMDKLFRLRARNAPQNDVQPLEDRQITLNRLRYAIREQPKLLTEPAYAGDAKALMRRTIARLGGDDTSEGLARQYALRKRELNARIDLYHWLANALGRTANPEKDRNDARLIELLVGLDLSDHGSRCGPVTYGFYVRNSSAPTIQDYREWFTRLQRDADANVAAAQWWKQLSITIDFDPLRGSRQPSTYLAGPLPVPSELSQAWGVPGMSMITLDDMRLRRDTPADTLDAINIDAILPQLAGVRDLFAHAAADPRFVGPAELKRLDTSFVGQVVSPSPGKPVPDLPREGFLTTYYYVANKDKKIPLLGRYPWAIGVRRDEIRQCDAEGNYRFEAMPRLRSDRLEGTEKLQADPQLLALHVYRIDAGTGAITATTDLGKQAGDIKWSVDTREAVNPVRSLVFNCEEFTLTRLYDPRFLQTLSEVLPLDARRNAEPQRYDMLLANQTMAGFVEPGTAIDLLFRYGRVGNRLALLNMSPAEATLVSPSSRPAKGDTSVAPAARSQARGYTPRQLNNLDPLALATSRDFYALDDQRLSDYRRAGVSAKLIDDLHADAKKQLDAAESSLRADDGVGLVRNATGAWANEARVYNAAQDMARDVVRAAIFLLMLCVPFAFCMERLLIGTPNVYRQIAGFGGIFAVMTLALWSFHPAFKISSSPLIIVLAFAIIIMSIGVIMVVYGRFDTELKRIRSGRGSGVVTNFASAGVLMSAAMLGIANMRKRKFRTALTSFTIVLITFAVLCFTSTTRYVGASTQPTGIASSHPGIMLRMRGFRPMVDILADQLRAVLADPALTIDRPQVVERWWAVSTSEPNEQYDLVVPATDGKPPRVISVPAVLGLSPGESRLSKIAIAIGEEKFARLEKGETKIVYLASATARRLGVGEGQTIQVGGLDAQVAGIFDGDRFEHDVRTLSGESIAPLRYVANAVDDSGKKLDDTTAESLDASAGADTGSYEHLPSTDFVIVPATLCRQLYKATLRSVAFRVADEARVKRTSEELARRFSLAMFAGYDDGVRLVAASNLSSVSGAGAVAIPLLIGGLIIFNTMMGSIAERRREIHVYTSLGLAPMHVGALFVAEALVYGLIGAVFGYVIGQGVGTLLLHLGWLGPVTLNYSGTSAIMTTALILGVVLLSSIIPARLASKIAAPSIDRTWKVPEPKDDTILATLPFTINKTAADGALAYLAEFFAAHRDGSIGAFAAGPLTPLDKRNGDADARGLRTSIWLTPFDLGVRQNLELLIHPGQFTDIYEVEVILRRQAGDDASWYRLNRPFLTQLRQQFLQWRSLSAEKMLEYVALSREMFAVQA